MVTLLTLLFFIARPQWVDSRSDINVKGVDIIITLDTSGSMQFFDDLQNRRQRINIAKQEATRFVKKRTNDPIGIVIFGADAISLCPLTLDKSILESIVRDIKLGIVNPQGTSLGTGLATAVNKLKHSKAKNKIIILLTDGQPTPATEKISIETALDLSRHFKIKVYTIAIGNKKGGYVRSAFGMIESIPDSVNEKLLERIAHETGGKFFRASSAKEMKDVYETINRLETTKLKTKLFSRYFEAFVSLIWVVLFLFFLELFLKIFVWRGIL
jgi:Ca-activated chloride channel family protein